MSGIMDYPDDIFWNEATRRWKQKTLAPVDSHRTAVMSSMISGQKGLQDQSPSHYPVVCSSCGKNTTVPFKPNPNRDVQCLDCYRARMGQ